MRVRASIHVPKTSDRHTRRRNRQIISSLPRIHAHMLTCSHTGGRTRLKRQQHAAPLFLTYVCTRRPYMYAVHARTPSTERRVDGSVKCACNVFTAAPATSRQQRRASVANATSTTGWRLSCTIFRAQLKQRPHVNSKQRRCRRVYYI